VLIMACAILLAIDQRLVRSLLFGNIAKNRYCPSQIAEFVP